MFPKISFLILARDESIHLQRILLQLPAKHTLVLVDSLTIDDSANLCRSFGARVLIRKFDSYSQQINFGLSYLSVCGYEWVIRIDADELFSEEDNIDNIYGLLDEIAPNISCVTFLREIRFRNNYLRRGGMGLRSTVRMVRANSVRCADRIMDEFFECAGPALPSNITLTDWNLKGVRFLWQKHCNYAKKEAAQFFFSAAYSKAEFCEASDLKKHSYYKLPIFFRALGLFFYRLVVKKGFADGLDACMYHLITGLGYRLLVDFHIFKNMVSRRRR